MYQVEELMDDDTLYNIPLSPIPESSERDMSMAGPSANSIFDPIEENEDHSRQHESSFHEYEQLERSSDATFMDESRITRSKSGAIPKRAPKEASTTTHTKRKGKRVTKESKETQVMPRMLPRAKPRASKSAKDLEAKENMPPTAPKKKQASDSKLHEALDVVEHEPPKTPKKQLKYQEIHDVSNIKRRIPASSSNTSSEADHTSPAAPSVHEDSRSPYGHSSMCETSSFADYEEMKQELDDMENEHRPPRRTENISTAQPSGLEIKKPCSDPNSQPMTLLICPELLKKGKTVGIKHLNGEFVVSYKQKQGSEKRRSNIRRRSHKNRSSSSESEYDSDSSSSCSAYYSSCCESSSPSSSDCDHHHRRRRRHRH